MECFEQYWHVHWHQKPQQDWLWHWTSAYSAGESCCSGDGERCSFSSSRPIAPPPLPLRCLLGWRGFPPGSERSGSIHRCAEQPAGGETDRELSLWPKIEAPPLRRAPIATSAAVHGEGPRHGPHQPAVGWLRCEVLPSSQDTSGSFLFSTS